HIRCHHGGARAWALDRPRVGCPSGDSVTVGARSTLESSAFGWLAAEGPGPAAAAPADPARLPGSRSPGAAVSPESARDTTGTDPPSVATASAPALVVVVGPGVAAEK